MTVGQLNLHKHPVTSVFVGPPGRVIPLIVAIFAICMQENSPKLLNQYLRVWSPGCQFGVLGNTEHVLG